MMLQDLGRVVIALGIVLIVLGSVLWFCDRLLAEGGKLPFLGKLPGDIMVQRENFSFYAPITTMILISIFLSIILTILANLKK